jgi:hypothetical protein
MLASVKSNRKRAHQPSDLAVGADVRLEPTFPDRNHGVPELAELSGNAAISTAVSCHFHPPECDVRFGRPPAPRAPVPKAPMNVSGGANVHQSWRFENDQAGKRLWSGRGAA